MSKNSTKVQSVTVYRVMDLIRENNSGKNQTISQFLFFTLTTLKPNEMFNPTHLSWENCPTSLDTFIVSLVIGGRIIGQRTYYF